MQPKHRIVNISHKVFFCAESFVSWGDFWHCFDCYNNFVKSKYTNKKSYDEYDVFDSICKRLDDE